MMKTMKRLLAVLIVSAVTVAAFLPMPAKAADGDITLSVPGGADVPVPEAAEVRGERDE